MRLLDDKIIYKLNTSLPTDSFKQLTDATTNCKQLYVQVSFYLSNLLNKLYMMIILSFFTGKKSLENCHTICVTAFVEHDDSQCQGLGFGTINREVEESLDIKFTSPLVSVLLSNFVICLFHSFSSL